MGLSATAVEKAAGCYELAVEMHSKLGSFLECAMAYKEAGSMFEKADRPNGAPTPFPSLSVRSLGSALVCPTESAYS